MAPDPELEKQKKTNEVAEAEVKAKSTTERQLEGLKPASSPIAAFTEARFNTYKTPETERAFKEKLKTTDVKEILRNRQLLNGHSEENFDKLENWSKITETKTETAKRLAAYTTKQGEWYTLDYESIGGRKHEMNIGLGDILLDEDITQVEIETDEFKMIGTRGYTEKGRPCFLDQNGNYIRTFTGDKFRILKGETGKETNQNDKTDQDIYLKKLNTTRDNVQKYAEYATKNGIETDFQFRNGMVEISQGEASAAKPVSDQSIAEKLNKQNFDGEDIIAEAKKACKHFNIEWEILRELLEVENGAWKVNLPYHDPSVSTAGGLGQFLNSTWGDFIKNAKAKGWKEEFGSKWASNWDQIPEGKYDPYAMVFATAWYANVGLAKLDLPSDIHISKKGALAYLTHHEGGAAINYLNFLDLMKSNGHTDKNSIKAAYENDPRKYNKVLHPKQVARIKKRGLENFLSVYFSLGKRIGSRAAKAKNAVEQMPVSQEEIDLPPNSKYSLKNNQSTWFFGSSIAVGINGSLENNRAGVLGIQNYRPGNFSTELLRNINSIKKLTPPKRIVILGLAHNDLMGRSAKESVATHLELVQLIRQNFPGIEIKIAQAHKYDNPTQNEKIEAFNRILEKEHPELYLEALEQASKLHPPRGEYNEMANLMDA